MTDMLSKLYAAKAAVRAADEAREPLDALRERAERGRSGRRGFRAALASARGPAIVAEIKRASPSVGLIVPHLDPAAIAREYEQAGADAISVLTESDHFLGELAYVDVARAASSLPLLRKDFLSTRYEVVQSAAYGADAILAIVAGLSDGCITEIMEEARRYDLDVLVEVHTEDELARALAAGATLLGINNRNLRTFETDLAVTEELLPLVPPGTVVISESGVKSQDDVRRLVAQGARGVLVGESLMRADDKGQAIRALKGAAVSV
ncbi:MAG: indole-3-glycerol phosphate synthase [Candidatus Eremiobacteraeota bacterium]|jgi:indole-3-glycerol phosphate synthase|nr:indole-3-glycerol phosphate synthase [Candidatus Eremiobacteraeota bacterium]